MLREKYLFLKQMMQTFNKHKQTSLGFRCKRSEIPKLK